MTTYLALIIGDFFGITNGSKLNSLELTLLDSNKEDVPRSILYLMQDGIVVRFNHIMFRTRYCGKSGGLGTCQGRLKPMFDAWQRFKKAYAEYGEIMATKTGIPEFIFSRTSSKIISNV